MPESGDKVYNWQTMELYLIRHAQSQNNALWEETSSRTGRSMDPGLTPLGYRQAAVLADFLARTERGLYLVEDPHNRTGFNLSHLYCSLMTRSAATAYVVGETLGLPVVAWPDWHECGGIYLEDELTGVPVGLPGNNRAYFEEHFPHLVLPEWLGEEGWWNRPFEERPQRWERARRVLDELLARHGGTDDRVAVVMHAGFYNYFMKTLLGIAPELPIWFTLQNTSITRLDFMQEETRMIYQNRLDFMPTHLLSYA